jgi:hypothetical protein
LNKLHFIIYINILINTNNLTVGTLAITPAGTAPIITDVDDNTNSIATTAFVQNHLNLLGVTLDTTQTIKATIQKF